MERPVSRFQAITILGILAIALAIIAWFWHGKSTVEYSVDFNYPLMSPIAINDRGHLLFQHKMDDVTFKGIIWDGNEAVEICPECSSVYPVDFNDRDEVVGTFKRGVGKDPDELPRPFFWSPENGMVEIMISEERIRLEPREYLAPVAINNHGRVLVTRKTHQPNLISGNDPFLDVGPSFVISVTPTIVHYARFPTGAYCYDLNDEGWVLVQDTSGIRVSNGTHHYDLEEIAKPGVSIGVRDFNNQGTVLLTEMERVKRSKGGFRITQKPVLWTPFEGSRPLSLLPFASGMATQSYCNGCEINDRDEVIATQRVLYEYSWLGNQLKKIGFRTSWAPKRFRRWLGGVSEIYPVLIRDGSPENINEMIEEPLEWINPGLIDINNRGQIVGIVSDEGLRRIVVLTPNQ